MLVLGMTYCKEEGMSLFLSHWTTNRNFLNEKSQTLQLRANLDTSAVLGWCPPYKESNKMTEEQGSTLGGHFREVTAL